MKNNAGKGNVILWVVLSIVLFSVFIKIDTLFSGNDAKENVFAVGLHAEVNFVVFTKRKRRKL